MAQRFDEQNQPAQAGQVPAAPQRDPVLVPIDVVPVAPLGRYQEPPGSRIPEGQVSADGQYLWRGGEWLPRLQPSADQASVPAHVRAERYIRAPRQAPEWGWRGVMQRRLHVTLKPSSAERRYRHLLQATQTVAPLPRFIAVASQKGGVGKTTTAMLLGSQFSAARNDRVLVLDSNPDSGSLAIRAGHRQRFGATDLVPIADQVGEHAQIRQFTTTVEETGVEVLPSLAEHGEFVRTSESESLAKLAARFYDVIVVDLGTGVAASEWWIANVHQVVVVATPAIDGAVLAESTIDHLMRRRGADWVRQNVVVLINQAGLGDKRIKVDDQERDLREHVRQVFRMGWDAHLALGGVIEWRRVNDTVRAETLRVTADLGANFTQGEHR